MNLIYSWIDEPELSAIMEKLTFNMNGKPVNETDFKFISELNREMTKEEENGGNQLLEKKLQEEDFGGDFLIDEIDDDDVIKNVDRFRGEVDYFSKNYKVDFEKDDYLLNIDDFSDFVEAEKQEVIKSLPENDINNYDKTIEKSSRHEDDKLIGNHEKVENTFNKNDVSKSSISEGYLEYDDESSRDLGKDKFQNKIKLKRLNEDLEEKGLIKIRKSDLVNDYKKKHKRDNRGFDKNKNKDSDITGFIQTWYDNLNKGDFGDDSTRSLHKSDQINGSENYKLDIVKEKYDGDFLLDDDVIQDVKNNISNKISLWLDDEIGAGETFFLYKDERVSYKGGDFGEISKEFSNKVIGLIDNADNFSNSNNKNGFIFLTVFYSRKRSWFLYSKKYGDEQCILGMKLHRKKYKRAHSLREKIFDYIDEAIKGNMS